MSTIHAALEIGTTRTVMAVGEAEPGGRIRVLTPVEIPSTGIRKSQILDIGQATLSIRSVLRELEKRQYETGSKISICNTFLVVSGQHIKASSAVGSTQLEGQCVTDDDIDAAIRSARQITLSKDREILDIVDRDFMLDNRGGIQSPKGMSGRILKLNTLQIHADHNRIQDARSAAEGTHLEIRDPLFAATCAADAVLEDHERKNGSLVLDLGGGSTGYAVYTDGALAAAGVIGVGGDHITNDIAHAFQTTNAQAEELKVTEASALLAAENGASERVKIPGSNPLFEGRTISRRALDIVVNARVKELVEVIAESLEEQDLLNRLHAGVVLTGGGARLTGIDALIQQTLGTSVRLGRPIQVDGLEDVEFSPSYAAIAGALLYANTNYEERGFFSGFFGRIFSK